MLREVKRAHKTNQPILIGTTSVDASELIAEALMELNITCQVGLKGRSLLRDWSA
jgi:preprotein translocase subunit SecA